MQIAVGSCKCLQTLAKIFMDFCGFKDLMRFSTMLSFLELDRDLKYLVRSHKIFLGGSG